MNCKDCKYFYKKTEIFGECAKIAILEQETINDIVIDVDVHDDQGLTISVKVGSMFGCIHFVEETK